MFRWHNTHWPWRSCPTICPRPAQRSLAPLVLKYNITRYTKRAPGSGRLRPQHEQLTPRRTRAEDPSPKSEIYAARPTTTSHVECTPSVLESSLWSAGHLREAQHPEASLTRILDGRTLVITRQIEMLNIFIGFEQANRYAISNEAGDPLGYILEESRGFYSQISRQLFRTRRPFRALVMDLEGSPVLWLRRPFAWLNSRMYVQKVTDHKDGEPVLETFGEVQQLWHLWRRRYDLFIRDSSRQLIQPILSKADEAQPEPEPALAEFHQFARVNGAFWTWNFSLRDERNKEIAAVDREFRGFGREIFTDTGQYVLRFYPTFNLPVPTAQDILVAEETPPIRTFTAEEKALILAMAVNIDFDYFSRHSGGSGMSWLHWMDSYD